MDFDAIINDPKTLVVINHSGGKDSQAMYLLLKDLVPKNRLVVIHAHLGEIEWPGTIDHITTTISHELFVVQAGKTFFEMVRHRKMWPSPKNRQCTSDLKRGPIAKKVRQLTNERGFDKVLNCIGLRAEESSSRAKKKAFKINNTNTNSKRIWYDWLPIHDWDTNSVFSWIKQHEQAPHWAYQEGMTRLSCSFCIMSSKDDLKTACQLRPALYEKYVKLEKEINHTFIMPNKHGRKFLPEIINQL